MSTDNNATPSDALENNEMSIVTTNNELPKDAWDDVVVPAATTTPFKSTAMFIPVDEPDKPIPRSKNTFAAKKIAAQGMMDIALLTANANQLRYIIEFNSNSVTFYLNVVLIVISLMLQVVVGVALIFKGRLHMRGLRKAPFTKSIDSYILVAVFLVTIINVFIASFTITGSAAAP